MANPPLVAAADLAEFPGAPFVDSIVNAAADSVRGDAGWHIAPPVTETVAVYSHGGRYLFLPTLQLSAVTEVRYIPDSGAPTVLDGWRNQPTTRFRAGILDRPEGWPCGDLEVDIEHGYTACPADLLPAIAFRCQQAAVNQGQGSVRLGSLSLSPGSAAAEAAQPDAVITRYRIPRSR